MAVETKIDWHIAPVLYGDLFRSYNYIVDIKTWGKFAVWCLFSKKVNLIWLLMKILCWIDGNAMALLFLINLDRLFGFYNFGFASYVSFKCGVGNSKSVSHGKSSHGK